MSIEAMKQALEALEIWEQMYPMSSASAYRLPAITSLHQAITDAEKQEPVAYLSNKRQRLNIELKPQTFVEIPTVTDWEMPLYMKPQQRTWIGLTDEEFEQLLIDAKFTRSDLLMIGACVEDICNMVEAKLKEKNT